MISVLSESNCMHCHGGVRQKNGVSFLFREEALGVGKSGRRTIVPGKPDESELMARVTSRDPETRMPYHAPPLPPQQIALLRRWIKEGASGKIIGPSSLRSRSPCLRSNVAIGFAGHWTSLFSGVWRKKDSHRRLKLIGLHYFAEFLDLTGLPPTPEEQAAFLSDRSADSYEKQVDRLLASPRYGERWASMWLDLARYADTKGYEKDMERPGVWPYRDWVIDAFNSNLPYDKFVITQLAGDLLPAATFEDQIATSFHRQTPVNDEGGTDDEEFRMVAVMDRSATTWSVLNGLTINCVQCHSHPYDPIRHAEYYKSLAFFNTTQDADLFEDTPVLRVPKDRTRYSEASQLQRELGKVRQAVVSQGRLTEAQSEWTPLPINAASASEALALQWETSELERQLAHLKEKKLRPKKEESVHKSLVTAIAETRKAARAKAGKVTALQIHDGCVQAGPNVPGKVVYELTAKIDVPVMTALRIEVAPANSETARHTPEAGFIVDRIDAWIVRPDGQEKKIAFRYFVPDSGSESGGCSGRCCRFETRAQC